MAKGITKAFLYGEEPESNNDYPFKLKGENEEKGIKWVAEIISGCNTLFSDEGIISIIML